MVEVKVAVPKVRNGRGTKRPARSPDLRQKMSNATAPYAAAKTTSMATEKAAKASSERPTSSSARRPAGESCPVGHAAVRQGSRSWANSAGTAGAKRDPGQAATLNQT